MSSARRKLEERIVALLRELSHQPENKHCFDCDQRGPTYINMTIGSFVCTGCSGILRGITPPHRVKSISMAIFTNDEVEFIKARGNDYCRKIWLGLYDGSRTSNDIGFKDDTHTKDFLINKYEKKRWYVSPSEISRQEQLLSKAGGGAGSGSGMASPIFSTAQNTSTARTSSVSSNSDSQRPVPAARTKPFPGAVPVIPKDSFLIETMSQGYLQQQQQPQHRQMPPAMKQPPPSNFFGASSDPFTSSNAVPPPAAQSQPIPVANNGGFADFDAFNQQSNFVNPSSIPKSQTMPVGITRPPALITSTAAVQQQQQQQEQVNAFVPPPSFTPLQPQNVGGRPADPTNVPTANRPAESDGDKYSALSALDEMFKTTSISPTTVGHSGGQRSDQPPQPVNWGGDSGMGSSYNSVVSGGHQNGVTAARPPISTAAPQQQQHQQQAISKSQSAFGAFGQQNTLHQNGFSGPPAGQPAPTSQFYSASSNPFLSATADGTAPAVGQFAAGQPQQHQQRPQANNPFMAPNQAVSQPLPHPTGFNPQFGANMMTSQPHHHQQQQPQNWATFSNHATPSNEQAPNNWVQGGTYNPQQQQQQQVPLGQHSQFAPNPFGANPAMMQQPQPINYGQMAAPPQHQAAGKPWNPFL